MADERKKRVYRSGIDLYISEKMKVLLEFGVVNRVNDKEIEEELYSAVRNNPDKDPERVVDRIARTMIVKKLGD